MSYPEAISPTKVPDETCIVECMMANYHYQWCRISSRASFKYEGDDIIHEASGAEFEEFASQFQSEYAHQSQLPTNPSWLTHRLHKCG